MKKEWITTAEAEKLMTESHGRKISQGMIRNLARAGKVESKVDEERSIVLLNKADIEAYHFKRRTDKRVEVRVRDKRSGKPAGRPRKNDLPKAS